MLPVSRWLCTCICICTLRYNSHQLSHLRATTDWLVNGLVWNITESSSCSLTVHKPASFKETGGGGAQTIFGYQWVSRLGFENLTQFRTKKNSKIHTLFGTKHKMHAVFFLSHFPPVAEYWANSCYGHCFWMLGLRTNFFLFKSVYD